MKYVFPLSQIFLSVLLLTTQKALATYDVDSCKKVIQRQQDLKDKTTEPRITKEKPSARKAPRTPWEFIAREFIRKSASKPELVKMISDSYPEIRWLKAKTAVSPETANFKISNESPSMMIYNESQPEFDRTMVSILNV